MGVSGTNYARAWNQPARRDTVVLCNVISACIRSDKHCDGVNVPVIAGQYYLFKCLWFLTMGRTHSQE